MSSDARSTATGPNNGPDGKERTVEEYHKDLHRKSSFDTMNEMRKQNLLCDVTLVAEDAEIPVHKIVLASCSPYFYAMFTNFKESQQERITLRDVDHRALELLIEYVYTSTVEVNKENVEVLLTTSNLLQLTGLREVCCDYMRTQLDASNCLGIRKFADLHECVDLLNNAQAYIEHNFREVIKFDEFVHLNYEEVLNLIGNDRISVPTEERVYECVITWIRFDPSMREQYTAALMQHVRWPLLSKEYVMQRVYKEPLLQVNMLCKDLLIEAMAYHLLPNDTKSARSVARKPVGMSKLLFVIGGTSNLVAFYDLRQEKWYKCVENPNHRNFSQVSVIDDKVYVVGGVVAASAVSTVDVYDPSVDQWSTSTSMTSTRYYHGVVVLNGRIYAVGGSGGLMTAGLSSAEVYDPKTEDWHVIASMSTPRSSVGVGVVNGLLYAVGGYNGYSEQRLSSVERYNPETNTWRQVADMSERRSGVGVGVLNNVLYAVGGWDGLMTHKSVEAFDIESNQWHFVADMIHSRCNAGVAAHDGLLYVVGGNDGHDIFASVEVYCPETDTWRTLSALMPIELKYVNICLIDKPMWMEE